MNEERDRRVDGREGMKEREGGGMEMKGRRKIDREERRNERKR
jgi:hypothetical protein